MGKAAGVSIRHPSKMVVSSMAVSHQGGEQEWGHDEGVATTLGRNKLGEELDQGRERA